MTCSIINCENKLDRLTSLLPIQVLTAKRIRNTDTLCHEMDHIGVYSLPARVTELV